MNRSQKLPRKCILKKNDAFHEVIEKGKIWRGKLVKVFYVKSDKSTVGFSVPKKFGKAVLRNRAKRLMREAYRKHRFELPSCRIVMIPREGWDLVGYRHLEEEFQSLIRWMKTSQE